MKVLKSRGEVELNSFMETLDIKFETHNRSILDGREIDFLCPEQKIGFEFNGDYWHSSFLIAEKYGIKATDFHGSKCDLAQEKGYSLYYIWNSDWINRRQDVERAIIDALSGKYIDPLITKLENDIISEEQFAAFKNKYLTRKKIPEYKIICEENLDFIKAAAIDVTYSTDDVANELNIAATSFKRFLRNNNISWTNKRFPKVDIAYIQMASKDPCITKEEVLNKIAISDVRTFNKLLEYYEINWTLGLGNKHILLHNIERIREMAEDKAVTQKDAAQSIGTSQVALSRFCSKHKIKWARTPGFSTATDNTIIKSPKGQRERSGVVSCNED